MWRKQLNCFQSPLFSLDHQSEHLLTDILLLFSFCTVSRSSKRAVLYSVTLKNGCLYGHNFD